MRPCALFVVAWVCVACHSNSPSGGGGQADAPLGPQADAPIGPPADGPIVLRADAPVGGGSDASPSTADAGFQPAVLTISGARTGSFDAEIDTFTDVDGSVLITILPTVETGYVAIGFSLTISQAPEVRDYPSVELDGAAELFTEDASWGAFGGDVEDVGTFGPLHVTSVMMQGTDYVIHGSIVATMVPSDGTATGNVMMSATF